MQAFLPVNSRILLLAAGFKIINFDLILGVEPQLRLLQKGFLSLCK